MKRVALVLILLALPVATFAAGRPSSKVTARKLFREGNTAFNRGDYSGALEAFQKAFALYPNPKLQLNIARAQEQLGDPLAAAASLESFVSKTGPDPTDPQRRYEYALAALRRIDAAVGHLAFLGPPGTTIFLDGKETGKLPLPVQRVLAGKHTVRAISPSDAAPFEASVEAPAGREVPVAINWSISDSGALPKAVPHDEEDSEADEEDAEEGAEEDSAEARNLLPPELSEEMDSEQSGSDSLLTKWWFWAAVGAGVAAAGVGAALLVGGGSFEPGGELGVSSTRDWDRL